MKVHVWAGISKRGRTGICIFEGIMDAPLYIEVLTQTLLPFLERVYPDGYHFMADNDLKHTSNDAKDFMELTGARRQQRKSLARTEGIQSSSC